jgi:hypothetical protein
MSYPLQQLKDIHPGPPPAANILTGVVSLALVFILLAGVCFLCYRLWPLLRAYGQLRRLSRQAKSQHPDWVPALNHWLKATALLTWPRSQIAPQHGLAWLSFLDHTTQGDFMPFAASWNGWLYGQRRISEQEQQALLRSCRRWLQAQMVRCLWSR